jgi:hypothetical protein
VRQNLTTALELAGLGCVSAAAFLFALPLGLLTVGACLVLVGVTEGRR